MKIASAFLVLLLVLLFVVVAIAFVRGMIAGQRQFAAESTKWFERQKFAPAIVIIGAAVLAVLFNVNFLELLVAGRLPASTKTIEGLSASQSYWFYLAASGILSLVIDIKIALFFWRMKKAKNA